MLPLRESHCRERWEWRKAQPGGLALGSELHTVIQLVFWLVRILVEKYILFNLTCLQP